MRILIWNGDWKMNISALNEDGNPVDWWFLYKAPELGDDGDPHRLSGYEYIYYDPVIGKVVKSPYLLTSGEGALDLTLSSIFDNPDTTTGWILYNDESPDAYGKADNHSGTPNMQTTKGGNVDDTQGMVTKDSSKFGHTKGVIAFDTESKTAFWLLHSWPKYADPKDPVKPATEYGQTFLWISIDMATAGNIAEQMTNHQVPQVYHWRTPTSLSRTDALYRLTRPLNPSASGDSSVLDCTSRGGLAFKVITKNRKWGKDFWNDLVGPSLQADMHVETWIRGAIPPTEDSDGTHQIVDVKFIDLRQFGPLWIWPESDDHAKWGHTITSNWICVGDINRMISQEKRGGGTIAFQDEVSWDFLSKTDLVQPATGQTLSEAYAQIKRTHVEADKSGQ